jgi:L-ascorbate metabolism protein UlaG (beta-lactamase superfamily)
MPILKCILLAILAMAGVAANPAASDGATLRAKFLGVTTILFDDGETAIMTDGFFSRPGLVALTTRPVAPDLARIGDALKKAGVTRLAAVMTAHSHYDHAFDTPVVAARTGAVIIGSESTANIARGFDFPEGRIRVIKGGESFTFGRFRITAIKSPHSPNSEMMGEITKPLRPPTRLWDYREGGNYSFLVEHDGRRVLIHASANFSRGLLRGMGADVVFLGIGTLGKQSDQFIGDYWRETVLAAGAKLVIPIHWDNFFKPLDEPLEPFPPPADDFDRTMKLLNALAAADKVEVRMPRAFETIELGRQTPP